MSTYRFPCCGKELVIIESYANSITKEHNCTGDVPCIGVAFIMGHSEPAADDVASPELDAALDTVRLAEDPNEKTQYYGGLVDPNAPKE